jgi:hypothetical protein
VGNLPITRGEKAIMAGNGLVSKWQWDEDDGLTEDLAAADTLLWELDDDVYDDYVTEEVAGDITDYLPSSERIEVAGELYDLANVAATDLVVNDDTAVTMDWANWDDDGELPDTLVEDDEVVLTLNDDDEVTKVTVTRDTYENELLTAVATESDETMFGDITVDGDTLEVDDDTDIMLDGEEVTLAELEDAFDDFEDQWDTQPVVSVRTKGDVYADGEYANWISVLSTDTIAGEIERKGVDTDGDYIEIDGERYYYDLLAGAMPDEEDDVTLLLGHDGDAYVVLDEAIDLDMYQARLIEHTGTAANPEEATFELPDGSTLTIETDDGDGDWNWNAAAAAIDTVYEIEANDEDVEDIAAAGPDFLETVENTYITVEAGGNLILADDVIVEIDGDFETMSDVETQTNIDWAVNVDGVVDYIVAQDPGFDAALALASPGAAECQVQFTPDADVDWAISVKDANGTEVATRTGSTTEGTAVDEMFTGLSTAGGDNDHEVTVTITDNHGLTATATDTVTVD